MNEFRSGGPKLRKSQVRELIQLILIDSIVFIFVIVHPCGVDIVLKHRPIPWGMPTRFESCTRSSYPRSVSFNATIFYSTKMSHWFWIWYPTCLTNNAGAWAIESQCQKCSIRNGNSKGKTTYGLDLTFILDVLYFVSWKYQKFPIVLDKFIRYRLEIYNRSISLSKLQFHRIHIEASMKPDWTRGRFESLGTAVKSS